MLGFTEQMEICYALPGVGVIPRIASQLAVLCAQNIDDYMHDDGRWQTSPPGHCQTVAGVGRVILCVLLVPASFTSPYSIQALL